MPLKPTLLFNSPLYPAAIMAVIDYLTGMIAAGYNGELKSKVGFKGIAKKVVLFILVGAAAQLDTVLGSNKFQLQYYDDSLFH
ncbi:phage holin family protein [Escherichia coli]